MSVTLYLGDEFSIALLGDRVSLAVAGSPWRYFFVKVMVTESLETETSRSTDDCSLCLGAAVCSGGSEFLSLI